MSAEFAGGQFERVRTLAALRDHEAKWSVEFRSAGSPMRGGPRRPCVYSSGVREVFPSEPD